MKTTKRAEDLEPQKRCPGDYPSFLRMAAEPMSQEERLEGGYPTHYLVRLRTGEMIRFTRAVIEGKYVCLSDAQASEREVRSNREVNLAGMLSISPEIEVRVSDIVWCWGTTPKPEAEPEEEIEEEEAEPR
jgi:hypothetical protein